MENSKQNDDFSLEQRSPGEDSFLSAKENLSMDESVIAESINTTIPDFNQAKTPPHSKIEIKPEMKIAEDLVMETAALDRENTNYKQENQAIRDDGDGCWPAFLHYLLEYSKISMEIFELEAQENDLEALLQENVDNVEIKRLSDKLETFRGAIAKTTAKKDQLKIQLQQAEINGPRLQSVLEQKIKKWRELNEICESLTKK